MIVVNAVFQVARGGVCTVNTALCHFSWKSWLVRERMDMYERYNICTFAVLRWDMDMASCV